VYPSRPAPRRTRRVLRQLAGHPSPATDLAPVIATFLFGQGM
jgi:hypothetical protein